MATKKGDVLVKANIATNQVEKAELIGARTLKSGNIVLVFDGAEVIMPGGWKIDRDLCVGDKVAAYWTEEEGGNRFHLEYGD